MDFKTFTRLKTLFRGIKSLILTGIAEPLLRSQIESFIAFARERMLPQSKLGFQTNGALLSEGRLKEITRVCINRVCVSIDSLRYIKGLHNP